MIHQETFREFFARLFAILFTISTIAVLTIIVIVMGMKLKEIDVLAAELGIDTTIEQTVERIPVQQQIEHYIDSLPIPEKEENPIVEEVVIGETITEEEIKTEEAVLEEVETEETREDEVAVEELAEEMSEEVQPEKETEPEEVQISQEESERKKNELMEKVQGIQPTIRNLNTSAYCACVKCCNKESEDGITASGTKATQWYTVAAGKGYELGRTIIYIPSLADKPNGGWFLVEDRGGKISNDHLDIFFDRHSEALEYGRSTVECYIYQF